MRGTDQTPRQLANSQQFESNYNKLRASIQAYLNTNKIWTAHDFRNDMVESDLMEVDYNKGRSLTTKTKSATCVERKDTSRETVGHSERGRRCKSGIRHGKRVCVYD